MKNKRRFCEATDGPVIRKWYARMRTADLARMMGLTVRQITNFVHRESPKQWARKCKDVLSKINSENGRRFNVSRAGWHWFTPIVMPSPTGRQNSGRWKTSPTSRFQTSARGWHPLISPNTMLLTIFCSTFVPSFDVWFWVHFWGYLCVVLFVDNQTDTLCFVNFTWITPKKFDMKKSIYKVMWHYKHKIHKSFYIWFIIRHL